MNRGTSLTSALSALAIFLFTTGCNSSSSSGGPSFKASIETIGKVDQYYSVVRVKTNNASILRYGFGDFNAAKQRLASENTNLEAIWTDSFGTYLDGEANTAIEDKNQLTRYTDNDSESIYMDLIASENDFPILEVGGESNVTFPSGKHRYSGDIIIAVFGSREGNNWGRGTDYGQFIMNVDFSDGTGTLEGYSNGISGNSEDSGEMTLDGSKLHGSIKVSTADGTFENSRDGMKIENTVNSRSLPILLHGSFHGVNADGLTGLYWSNTYDRTVFGSIAGVRNLPARGIDYLRVYGNYYNVVQVETNEKILLRYGFEENTTPRRRLVFENIEKGRQTLESTEWGDITWGNVDLGLTDDGVSLSLMPNEGNGLILDAIRRPDKDFMLEVGGDRLTSVPDGEFTYRGLNLFGTWGLRSRNRWGTGNQTGRFDMTVDFDRGGGQIRGETDTRPPDESIDTLDGSKIDGDFLINTATGEFRSNNLSVINTISKEEFIANLNGNFHGEGARGVTGIYAEQSASPDFFGAIAGTQVQIQTEAPDSPQDPLLSAVE